MIIERVNGHEPKIDPSAFIAPDAVVLGDVELGPKVNIWYGCVLRGDINWIKVGAKSNIQDLCVVHVDHRKGGTFVGEEVTVGHRALLHSCRIEDKALIGMGAIVLDEAVVGEGALVAAGAVVPPRMKVPPRHLVAGVPARVIRELPADQPSPSEGPVRRYLRVMDCYQDRDLEVDFSKL